MKDDYEVIVIGAGGHGPATAHYLAKEFGIRGIRGIAVLERGWLGGGNVARNAMTIRSNYMRDESIPFYVKSVAMYEGLAREHRHIYNAEAIELPVGDNLPYAIETLWRVETPGPNGKAFLDLQNDATVDDAYLAQRDGYTNVEHVKRNTTGGNRGRLGSGHRISTRCI